MALEPITRQEQIIAGKDLEPITRMEKFLKDYGVSNYFGETTVKGDTLTWDGNTEGLVSVDAFAEMLGTLYKISDAVPTLEDCISGATYYIVAHNGEQENRSVGHDEIAEMSSFVGCLCIGDFIALVAPENNFQIEVEGVAAIFPEAGLYTAFGSDITLTSLTIPGYTGFETKTIKRLDEKYMPILTSPNGTKFRLAVNDDGTVTTAEVTE